VLRNSLKADYRLAYAREVGWLAEEVGRLLLRDLVMLSGAKSRDLQRTPSRNLLKYKVLRT
jgi:hypothetical protein